MLSVWIRKTRRQGTCVCGCGEKILNGEYQVVCQHYMKLRSGKTWWKRRIFKPQHWIDQAIAELEKRPVVETRGRKKLPMTDDSRAARTAILRRRGSVLQRIRREVEGPKEEQDIDNIVHLGGMLNKLKEEIEPYGGVPKSWM